ncbi:phosphoesterase [Paracoccus sp. IB05]|uniref:phosphoesterase n=1 Tax=Paracoccus sp. IB05 TaxID=2779367 RepID=UPI0018E8F5A0|nr:phosphoesterase [Paracoccus sp. IB05]MBJ2152676.1 phosphoesterase [Paracoccus sp. IB05]
MTTWFTADQHLSHENIIAFCGRPFPDATAMDAAIIAELQARVRDEDDLWILGDFAVSKATGAQRAAVRAMFDAIPGHKHLVVGNHDRAWIRDLPWDSIAPMADILVEGRRLCLCHYPMITWPGARRGALQLFGHVHQNWRGTRNSVNVGVDMWDFRPVPLPEIEARAACLPINRHWDQVEPGCSFPTVLCVGCHTVLDPQPPSGHAVMRGESIVVWDDGEIIASLTADFPASFSDGDHLCAQCIGGHLSVRNLTIAEGFRYDERINRSYPDA